MIDISYIKSPFNYIGGKYKLLPQILPLFPQKINMFYDVFGGGCNVGLNVKSEYVYYNDIVNYVGNVFNELKGLSVKEVLTKIHNVIDKYKLSKTNAEGFLRLRNDYNNGNKSWEYFYTLICFSFNNQYRFNNKHEYNSSFGKHKSCFSDVTEKKIIEFMNRLNDIDITFDSKDFRHIDFTDTNENDLVYFDPPYLISTGNYNDGKRGFKGWNDNDEIDLHNLCDLLDSRNIMFAMSNVLVHKGKENKALIDWSKKYKIHNLEYNYGNSNYQTKDRSTNGSLEVLITNY